MTYEHLLIDRAGTDGRVARITLNRPEKLNALSQELLFELEDALKDLEPDESARAIILRGAGRAFSAGYDLTPPQRTGADAVVRAFRGRDEQGRALWANVRGGMQRIADIQLYFWNMQKITLAQVHGHCLAGGLEMAMMADFVLAADDCRLGHPGFRFGTSRNAAMIPMLVGMRKAKELFYTGDSITGAEAAKIGLVNSAHPADQLDDATVAMADRVAIMPADHLAMLKVHINRWYENMGIYSSIRSSVDLDAIGVNATSQAYGWRDKMTEGGLKEALAWRDGPYQDYRSAQRQS